MDAWQSVVSTVGAEFSDLSREGELVRLLVRVLMAGLLGGLLGLERELHGKAAGIRTHMLLAMAAALIVQVPLQAGMGEEAVSRVVQGLLAGVGLLCAGTILKPGEIDHAKGLTSATGLWMATAIGVASGMGRGATALVGCLLAFAVLSMEGPIKRLLHKSGKLPPPDH